MTEPTIMPKTTTSPYDAVMAAFGKEVAHNARFSRTERAQIKVVVWPKALIDEVPRDCRTRPSLTGDIPLMLLMARPDAITKVMLHEIECEVVTTQTQVGAEFAAMLRASIDGKNVLLFAEDGSCKFMEWVP